MNWSVFYCRKSSEPFDVNSVFDSLGVFRVGSTPGSSQGALLSKFSWLCHQCLVLLWPLTCDLLQVNVSATQGTLNVAAEVDGVKIKGDGEMHMTVSSSLLANLNRQLQFVTYTNTLFHPSTADMGEATPTFAATCLFGFFFFQKKEIKQLSEMVDWDAILCLFGISLNSVYSWWLNNFNAQIWWSGSAKYMIVD